jgi:hypothetical protein
MKMKQFIAEIEHNKIGVIKYYLVKTFKDDYPGVELYGIGIYEDKSGKYTCVENVDINKERIEKFILCLRDGIVTGTTLKELCEDYVEMLTDRS